MAEARVLGDRYELGDVLGRGGMAEVHMGRDVRLGRSVAVKTLRVDLARDPTFQKRFRREAQSAASLNHPAVVAVYDTGEDNVDGAHVPYIVMEYVDGSTLRELLNSGRRLLPERALEITAGVLSALDYSHRNGIVHRDIKPANVMLTRSGEVKVMDFGIARAVADTAATMTQTAAVIGTAQYLSPEQARGEQVDARSDLYSTGCLLYELLTGRPPFVGDSPVSVAYQHVREDPVPPSQLDPDLPKPVDAIVMKALAKNRDNRYQSAAEMREDIERAIAGQPVRATPVMAAPVMAEATRRMAPVTAPTVTPPPPGGGRRTAGYVLLAVAVLAVFGLAAFAALALLGGGGDKVRVPNVTGIGVNRAENVLRDAGLVMGEQTPRFSDEPEGRILEQDPPADSELEQGQAVDVVVSRGVEQTTVPGLEGLALPDARRALADAGLRVGNVEQEESELPAGQVLSSDPPEGERVDRDSEVDLVVSSGEVVVPGVIGGTEEQARATLESVGLQVEVVTQEDADTDPGIVLAQSPEEGASVPAGTPVTITVAVEPEPEPTPTPTESPTPTPTESPSESPSPSPSESPPDD